MPLAVLLPVALLPVALYLAIWVHELGHAVAYRLAGATVTSVGVGLGGVLFARRVGGTIVYAGRKSPFQGVTFVDAGLGLDRRPQVVGFLGGPAANAAAAAAFAVAPPGAGWGVVEVFAAINAVSAAVNLVPLRVTVGGVAMYSDGRRAWDAVRFREAPSRVSSEGNVARMLGGLWDRIGDRQLVALAGYLAARSWAWLRNPGRAAAARASAEAAHADTPRLRFFAALARGYLCRAAGDPDGVEAALDLARAEAVAAANPRLTAAVELIRADSRAESGHLAADALDRLPGVLADVRDPYVRFVGRLVEYRLATRLGRPAPVGAEAEFDARLADPVTDPAVRFDVWAARAARAERDGDLVTAEAHLRMAVGQVEAIAAELLDPADRADLDPLRAHVRGEFARVVAAQGRDPTADSADPGRSLSAAPDAALVRQRGRQAAAVLAVLLVASVGVLVAVLESRGRPGHGRMPASPGQKAVSSAAILAGVGSAAGLAYAAVTAVASLVRPTAVWGRHLPRVVIGLFMLTVGGVCGAMFAARESAAPPPTAAAVAPAEAAGDPAAE